MNETFHVKYRPQTFEDVVGQDAVVKPLLRIIEKYEAQSFLFSGPSGTGKTTLARICAYEVGCETKDILEIDGATFTGVDAMRQVQQVAQYRPFGKSEARAIIIDECHRLSKQAWESLLKVIEEPPPHAYWFLCTTEVGKVPHTIKTRCASFTLKSVNEAELTKIVTKVCKAEKLSVDSTVVDVIVKEAYGSPRQALVNLTLAYEAKNRKEAAAMLASAQESDPTRELCQFLLKGGSWAKAMGIIAKMDGENPEGVRIVVCNYMASVLKSAKTDREATAVLSVLDAFSTPFNASENTAPLLLAVGRVLYAD